MKIGSAFPSNYLKADDLGDAKPVVTIERVVMEDVGNEQKPVVFFKGKDKGLILNRTNANAIEMIAGTDETDNWRGHRVTLFRTKVDFQGRRVAAIRIEEPPTGQAKKEDLPPPTFNADDSDVPF